MTTRNQLQEKNLKKKQHVEAKEYATKQTLDHRRNQRRKKKKNLETNENGNTMLQNLWNAAKAVLGGNL